MDSHSVEVHLHDLIMVAEVVETVTVEVIETIMVETLETITVEVIETIMVEVIETITDQIMVVVSGDHMRDSNKCIMQTVRVTMKVNLVNYLNNVMYTMYLRFTLRTMIVIGQ